MDGIEILIMGAGPAGLSAAIALSKISTTTNPIRVTIIELRSEIQTIGGAVNLTPLALQYLDYLGAGTRLRSKGYKIDSIDIISLRTGGLLGSLWKGLDSLRVLRQEIIESLVQTAHLEHGERVQIRNGMRVTSIEEKRTMDGKSKVVLRLDTGEKIEGDVVLGCDGLHSAARRLYVEHDRQEAYTGRVVVMGFAGAGESDSIIGQSNGGSDFGGTALIQGQTGSLLVTYFEPSKSKVFLASVMGMAEPKGDGDLRDGWELLGSDGAGLKKDILRRYQSGRIHGVEQLISDCEEWNLYPVYKLPPGGSWRRGRVLLLGDAAHAVSHFPLREHRLPSISELADRQFGRCHRKGNHQAMRSKMRWSWHIVSRGVTRGVLIRCYPTTS
jgi:2-polyprenyl-6-methoxyphenol hydroxylase-like FAD-dependent oxidoreductase